MFGLDERIAGLSNGTTFAVVAVISVVLGLRHASDPDHLAAVTTLVAAERERIASRAARLAFSWGLGHATSLFVFGLPVILYSAYLPASIQQAAETTVGVMIVALAIALLLRRKRRTRSSRSAFVIGLVHGMGGTAGVGVLLLASIHGRLLATAALALFAGCTAISMIVLSAGFGRTLSIPRVRRTLDRLVPAVSVASAAFGVWYALGAQGVVPYVF